MEVVNKLITNKYLMKIKITSVILASFCFEEMVPFYYFLYIPIPPFMGIIHSAKTVYNENPIYIKWHAARWVHADWPMCSPDAHYRPNVCGRKKQSLKQKRYSLLLHVKVIICKPNVHNVMNGST